MRNLSDDRQASADLAALVAENGYVDPRPIGGGRYACISRFLFGMCAIIVGRIEDRVGFSDRWDYPSLQAARDALAAWDGNGEPAGWLRHPASGRRVAQKDGEFDKDGQAVTKGTVYIRW